MSPSLDELVKQGEGDQEAADLGDGIFMLAASQALALARNSATDSMLTRLQTTDRCASTDGVVRPYRTQLRTAGVLTTGVILRRGRAR